jgi:hypothetical protein
MADIEGTLYVARSSGAGTVREEQLPFHDLQSLLDACVSSEGAALVRVEIVGDSNGARRRLVLDFGQLGRDEEE